MKFFITGGAGFIGSNLVDHLISLGHAVIVYDNFSTGRKPFLTNAFSNGSFEMCEGDIKDQTSLASAMRGCDVVVHFAANADVRFGLNQRFKDIQVNTIGTYNVLEAMLQENIKKILFSSTSSVYGEAESFPTPENCPFPIQTSLYATSKLSGEGLLTSYALGFDIQCWIYRFVSVLGPRYTHGHVFDFVKKLDENPAQLTVLGDGYQTKSYMHVKDCIKGILHGFQQSGDQINIFNVGSEQTLTVRESISIICKTLDLKPEIIFGESKGGWVGDNPYIYLSTQKLRELDWCCEYSIEASVKETVSWLLENKWCFDEV